MKKHIEVLESRRDYLKAKIENIHVSQEIFLDVFKEELAALNWALGTLVCPWTGEVTAEAETIEGLKVGDKVELLAALMHHRVGDIGTVDQIDTEDSHQYPYHYPYLIRVGDSVRLKYARHELKKVG